MEPTDDVSWNTKYFLRVVGACPDCPRPVRSVSGVIVDIDRECMCVCVCVCACRCLCRAGFDGPRCQQTRHSFSGGDTWALYPALNPCSAGHTSLELMTQHDNAVIMYHGPVTDLLQPGQISDFLLLEMRNGYPLLRIDHGSGLHAANTQTTAVHQNILS